MTTVRKVIVQSFVTGKRGRLDMGRARECSTISQAKNLADDLVRLETAAGAVVFVQDFEDCEEFGVENEPILVGYSGRVPQEIQDQM